MNAYDRVMAASANHFGVDVGLFKPPIRRTSKSTALARHVAAYVIWEHMKPRPSAADMAARLGYGDHSSASHGVGRVRECLGDPGVSEAVSAVRGALLAGLGTTNGARELVAGDESGVRIELAASEASP